MTFRGRSIVAVATIIKNKVTANPKVGPNQLRFPDMKRVVIEGPNELSKSKITYIQPWPFANVRLPFYEVKHPFLDRHGRM